MQIFAIDVGKYKSVASLFTAPDAEVPFHTVGSDPHHFRQLIRLTEPDVVVFETWTSAGGASDLCDLLACGPDAFLSGQLRLLLENHRRLNAQERMADRKLDHLACEDKNVQRMMTIPGAVRAQPK